MQLGFSHPDELAARLTARQLAGWKAYAAIEPFGEYRHELRHGQQMQLAHAVHCGQSRPLADFMNFVERPQEKKYTAAELEAYADKVFGG